MPWLKGSQPSATISLTIARRRLPRQVTLLQHTATGKTVHHANLLSLNPVANTIFIQYGSSELYLRPRSSLRWRRSSELVDGFTVLVIMNDEDFLEHYATCIECNYDDGQAILCPLFSSELQRLPILKFRSSCRSLVPSEPCLSIMGSTDVRVWELPMGNGRQH